MFAGPILDILAILWLGRNEWRRHRHQVIERIPHVITRLRAWTDFPAGGQVVGIRCGDDAAVEVAVVIEREFD